MYQHFAAAIHRSLVPPLPSTTLRRISAQICSAAISSPSPCAPNSTALCPLSFRRALVEITPHAFHRSPSRMSLLHAGSSSAAAAHVVLATVLLLLCHANGPHAAAVDDAAVAYVAQPASQPGTRTLVAALLDTSVSTISLQTNYTLKSSDFDAPVVLSRNLTITSQQTDPPPVLDFAFAVGVIELCGSCWITLANINTANEVPLGTRSNVLASVRGQPGSAIVAINYTSWRFVCIPTSSSIANIRTTPRSTLFADRAQQQEADVVTATFQGRTYGTMLHVSHMSYDVPLTLAQASKYTGGYAVLRLNNTRVCEHVASAECLQAKMPDECLVELAAQFQNAGGGPRPSDPSWRRAVAVAVPVAGGVLLAALAAMLFVARKRRMLCWRAKAPDQPAPGDTPWAITLPPPHDQDRFPAAGSSACSSQAGRLLQQPLSLGGPRDWAVLSSETVPAMKHAANSKIELGELLGAGSFARVFRGRWAGLEVAVKVIEHDSNATAAVVNEVQLNMSLHHPNIVQAFHYTTFVRQPSSTRQAAAGSPADAERSAGSQIGSSQTMLLLGHQPPDAGAGAAARDQQTFESLAVNRPPSVAVPDSPTCQPPVRPQPSLSSDACGSFVVPSSDVLSEPGLRASPQPSASGAAWPLIVHSSAEPGDGAAALHSSAPPGMLDIHASRPSATRCETWLVQELCQGTIASVAAGWSEREEHSSDAQMLQRLLLLQGAAKGLECLHAKSIVHGDLNSHNVLVSRVGSPGNLHSSCSSVDGPILVAKLADLGLSRVVKSTTHRTTRTVGTMSHMSPCLLQYGRLSPALDVYSFGVMMWELFTGQVAFQQLHYGQFFETVVLRGLRPEVPAHMPDDYQLLMERCWTGEPGNRPTVRLVLDCLDLMIDDRRRGMQLPAGGRQTPG